MNSCACSLPKLKCRWCVSKNSSTDWSQHKQEVYIYRYKNIYSHTHIYIKYPKFRNCIYIYISAIWCYALIDIYTPQPLWGFGNARSIWPRKFLSSRSRTWNPNTHVSYEAKYFLLMSQWIGFNVCCTLGWYLISLNLMCELNVVFQISGVIWCWISTGMLSR